MDLRKLKKLIDLVEESGISELELTEGEEKVRISRAMAPGVAPVTQYVAAPAPAPVAAAPATAVAAPAAAPVEALDGKVVKSPMVGTFYRAPSPEAAPFIEIGQTVEVGQVVCIVEAMKLMNEIKSEVRGKVVEICVDNAEPVEFGQVLFRVDPTK